MLALTPDSHFKLVEDVLLQSLSEIDHYYAFNTKDGDNFRLNHTAHWVLSTIGTGTNYLKLLRAFSKKYEVDKEMAEQDLREVLQYALENKIIKEVKP